MRKIKYKIQRWLGIEKLDTKIQRLDKLYQDLASLGVDIHFKEPHMILIYSRLNGGQIKHIEANFETMKDLMGFVRELQNRFKTERVFIDAPPQLKSYFKDMGY